MYQTASLPDSALARHPRINIRKLLMVFLICLTVISCVTINIYFPAAAAEKAAEKIVDEVLQSGDAVPADNTPDSIEGMDINANDDQSIYSRKTAWSATDYWLSSLVHVLIPAAHAGQANISIDSPKIRSIRNSMEKRQSKLKPYYKSGAAGFTNDGFIATVQLSGLSVKKQSTLKKLISAENKDRKALYSEIARANGHPEWQKDIQKTFAKTWINKISKGWMYQTPQGKWVKK
jgi:uncharacterized protein YdbL (DUF1318 family)